MPDPCRGMVRWYECANESRAIRNWLKEPLLSGCQRGGDSLSPCYRAREAGDKLSPSRTAELEAALISCSLAHF